MKNRRIISVLIDGLIYQNPLLVKMLSLSVAVLACASLKDAFIVGFCTLIALVLSSVTVSAIKNVLTEATKTLSCLFIITGYVSVICVIVKACFPNVDADVGYYLPFIAASGRCLSFCAGFAVKNSISSVAFGALSSGLGYMAALVVSAFVRELFGRGELFGISLFDGGITFLATPAGGFICFAFLAAAVSYISNRRRDNNDN